MGCDLSGVVYGRCPGGRRRMSAAVLEAVLRAGEAMREAARSARWDEVAERAGECDRLLRDWDVAAADAADAPLVHRLLEINEEVIAIGASHRDELQRVIMGSQHQRRAARAYASDAS